MSPASRLKRLPDACTFPCYPGGSTTNHFRTPAAIAGFQAGGRSDVLLVTASTRFLIAFAGMAPDALVLNWPPVEERGTGVTVIDSTSRGDPARFRSLDELKQMLKAMPASAKDEGRVALLMRRGEGGRRETLQTAVLEPDDGVPGDAWGRSQRRNGEMQIAVMEKAVAEVIGNGQPLALFGDCLVLDLDLSAGNLPPGSRLRVGDALLEVTPAPHNGCQKYRARFGADALRLVWLEELRHRNLRGIYMRVVTAGRVNLGDRATVLSRAHVEVSTKQEQFAK